MAYQFFNKKNNAISTLSGNMLVGDTTALVTSLVPFPPTPPFVCTIWNSSLYPDPSNDPNMEVVTVTSISSGNTFTIERAQEGTLARAHNSGLSIGHFVTVGQIQEHETQINLKAQPYRITFTNSSLSGSSLTITHNLGNLAVHVDIYDNNNFLIIPDSIQLTSINALVISFASYTPIFGAYNVIVTG